MLVLLKYKGIVPSHHLHLLLLTDRSASWDVLALNASSSLLEVLEDDR